MATTSLNQIEFELLSDESISSWAMIISGVIIAIVACLLFDHFSRSTDLIMAIAFTIAGLVLIIALALMDLALFILHFKRQQKGGK